MLRPPTRPVLLFDWFRSWVDWVTFSNRFIEPFNNVIGRIILVDSSLKGICYGAKHCRVKSKCHSTLWVYWKVVDLKAIIISSLPLKNYTFSMESKESSKLLKETLHCGGALSSFNLWYGIHKFQNILLAWPC